MSPARAVLPQPPLRMCGLGFLGRELWGPPPPPGNLLSVSAPTPHWGLATPPASGNPATRPETSGLRPSADLGT